MRNHPLTSKVSSRTLFGLGSFSRASAPPSKHAGTVPGLQEMVDLQYALRRKERPPPRDMLARAFTEFILYRQERHGSAGSWNEDSHVNELLQTFIYLKETETPEEGIGLDNEQMSLALEILRKIKQPAVNAAIIDLAKLLYDELRRTREIRDGGEDIYLKALISILARKGRAAEALNLLKLYCQDYGSDDQEWQWKVVLLGFVREGNQDALTDAVETMQKHGVPFNIKFHHWLFEEFLGQNNLAMAKQWYRHPIEGSETPKWATDVAMLKLCRSHKELEYGETFFKNLLSKEVPSAKPNLRFYWTAIFEWSAAKGTGVDEIERMMNVMVRTSKEQKAHIEPDMAMINAIVAVSNHNNDPYMAERYLALGQRWGLQPDASTFLLQLDYRMKAGDLDGARAAYNQLQGHEIKTGEDLSLVNKLIVATCKQASVKFDSVMSLVEDLNARQARLEPETVSALTLLHLQRGEMHDVVDLLNTHVSLFDTEQRAVIRDVMIRYCLDRSVTTSRAWDAYNILRRTFKADTDIETRTRMMNEFFDRGRSDMGTHVFGQMRHLDIPDLKPTPETYILCLEGIAKGADEESLTLVHNLLKLDTSVEFETRLYNALMLAYTACGDPRQSLLYWEDIVHSREGPTYNSILIALRACEESPFGERHARDIWSRLQRIEIEVTREIYAAYVGALAGQALIDECMQLVDNAERDLGYTPDTLL